MNPTRRRALAAIAGITTTSLTRTQAQQPAADGNKFRTSIHYELDFHARPLRFYQTILDQKLFAAFSGMAATIDSAPGGAFSMFGGMIVGRNIELIQSQRIVQAWRPTHWDPGVYSVVHFEIGPRDSGTALDFHHTGFPEGDYDSLDDGWHSHYWDPLKKFFA